MVDASVVFGVGHGPVDAVIVSVCCLPGEGFAAVVSAAERIHVCAGCDALWHWFVVVEVAAVCGDGVGGVAAGSGADGDGFASRVEG